MLRAPPPARAQVVVWGAAPEDTRVYVDGMRIPLLYHFGGFRSVDPLGHGALGRAHPGRLRRALRARPRRSRARSTRATRERSPARQRRPRPARRIRWPRHGPIANKSVAAIAARRSHLDAILKQVTSKDISAFFPIPKYYDGQARVRYQPAKHTFVELGGMISSDQVSRTRGQRGPSVSQGERKEPELSARVPALQTETADGGKVERAALARLGPLDPRLGALAAPRRCSRSTRDDYGFRASYRGRVAPFLTAEVGLDLEAAMHSARRVGSVTAPPREGDAHPFGQPPSDQINLDTWQTAEGSAAPYVEGDFSLFDDALHIVPGLRLEPQFSSVSKRVPTEGVFASVGVSLPDTALQPRLAVRYAMSSRVTFKAAFGSIGKPPRRRICPLAFGNPTLQSSRARQLCSVARSSSIATSAVETTVFRSTSEGLAARNPSLSPLTAQALVNGGEGRSYGVQFLLRHELVKGFFGWVAYTILRSERKDAGSDNIACSTTTRRTCSRRSPLTTSVRVSTLACAVVTRVDTHARRSLIRTSIHKAPPINPCWARRIRFVFRSS